MENYFRYLPIPPELLKWGSVLAASGFTRIPPFSAYPPVEHPSDHALNWSHGRVIEALQVVFLADGGGIIETSSSKQERVEAGMVFLILPNTWHRYRPDRETGWVESWIEVRGPVVDGLLQSEGFPKGPVLRQGVLGSGIEETLNRIHLRVGADEPGIQPELAALAMQVLAQCVRIAAGPSVVSNIQRAVHRAERHLSDHYREPLRIEELAKDLGVAYSHFRREFRKHTGYSPWRYVIHLRLTRARALMASSDATLDDIAAQTGFSSGFHLSTSFKQAYGTAPDRWRKAVMAKGRRP